jgi:hypothetical protein
MGQGVEHLLASLREARHFLIRALAFPTQAQHGIAALSQRE